MRMPAYLEVRRINKANTRAVKITALAVALLFFASALRFIHSESPLVVTALAFLTFTIYIGMLAAWGISIRRRMMHSHIRSYLLAIASLLLFWIFVRTLKWHVFEAIEPAARFLWYCFYFPMIFVPLLSFFAALCLGKPEGWRPSRRYGLLFIPAALLLLGILTNDMHQLAFGFAPGFEEWNSNYSYHILYFLTALWMAGFLLASVWLLFQKSHVPHTKRRVWMPLFAIGLGVVYAALYILTPWLPGARFIEMTAMYCALAVAIWESCIQTGLLPSNTRYGAFFDASDLAAQITDRQGKVHYSSRRARPVPAEVFARLTKEGELQPDADTVLHAAPIRGGYVVWREDVSELARLIEQLRRVGDELQDGVELLQSEWEVKSKRQRVDEQNRLYELTVRQTMPQLKTLNARLDDAQRADDGKKLRLLREINLLGSYIKRRGNLILIAEGKERVSLSDLARCFEESFESLGLEGFRRRLTVSAAGEVNLDRAILFYDFFQAVTHAGFASLESLLVDLTQRENDLTLSVEMESGESPGAFPDADWREEEVAALGGQILRVHDGDAHRFALRLPKGGERP